MVGWEFTKMRLQELNCLATGSGVGENWPLRITSSLRCSAAWHADDGPVGAERRVRIEGKISAQQLWNESETCHRWNPVASAELWMSWCTVTRDRTQPQRDLTVASLRLRITWEMLWVVYKAWWNTTKTNRLPLLPNELTNTSKTFVWYMQNFQSTRKMY